MKICSEERVQCVGSFFEKISRHKPGKPMKVPRSFEKLLFESAPETFPWAFTVHPDNRVLPRSTRTY